MIRIIPRYLEEHKRDDQDALDELELRIKLLRVKLDFEAHVIRYEKAIRSNSST